MDVELAPDMLEPILAKRPDGRTIAIDMYLGKTRVLHREASGGADDWIIVRNPAGKFAALAPLGGAASAILAANLFVAPCPSPSETDVESDAPQHPQVAVGARAALSGLPTLALQAHAPQGTHVAANLAQHVLPAPMTIAMPPMPATAAPAGAPAMLHHTQLPSVADLMPSAVGDRSQGAAPTKPHAPMPQAAMLTLQALPHQPVLSPHSAGALSVPPAPQHQFQASASSPQGPRPEPPLVRAGFLQAQSALAPIQELSSTDEEQTFQLAFGGDGDATVAASVHAAVIAGVEHDAAMLAAGRHERKRKMEDGVPEHMQHQRQRAEYATQRTQPPPMGPPADALTVQPDVSMTSVTIDSPPVLAPTQPPPMAPPALARLETPAVAPPAAPIGPTPVLLAEPVAPAALDPLAPPVVAPHAVGVEPPPAATPSLAAIESTEDMAQAPAAETADASGGIGQTQAQECAVADPSLTMAADAAGGVTSDPLNDAN